MTATALGAYTVAAVLMALTPGLDTMLILRSVLTSGRRAGFASLLGITCGCLVWATASIAGLTALLAASTLAYNTLRIAGATYLIWLGASALWKSRTPSTPTPLDLSPAPKSVASALRTGLLTNLLNPKVGAFYLSLLPQFLPTTTPASWAILLVAIHLAAGALWSTTVIALAEKSRPLLSRASIRRNLDRATATVLLAFGLKIALD